MARIFLLNAHPHGDPGHFCHALTSAYETGARNGGHEVQRMDLAEIRPEMLSDPADFELPPPDAAMRAAQEAVGAAEHVVIVFPLWLGTMPAMLKAFFEQLARGAFAIGQDPQGGWPVQHLKGRSARLIVTMGMPALAYRLWFLNAGVSNLRRLILGLSGIAPVRQTTIGGIGSIAPEDRVRWLENVEALGRAAR